MPEQPLLRSFAELGEDAKRQRVQLSKEMVIEDGSIVFKMAGDRSIELKRLNTSGKLLAWVYQLAGKPWMTPARLKFFIRLVGKRYDMKFKMSL